GPGGAEPAEDHRRARPRPLRLSGDHADADLTGAAAMNALEVIDLAREALWIAVQVGAPGLVAALVVGLSVSLVQAMTQIQEATLSFVPKALGVGIAILVTLPFTVAALVGFGERLFLR